jgi:hypothetical protein
MSQDPQLPQGFYPVADQEKKLIYPGDVLGATCDFDSTESPVTVRAGSTRKVCRKLGRATRLGFV